jgi:protein-S-isoprenylcysteine O-methyltransferase Ste14
MSKSQTISPEKPGLLLRIPPPIWLVSSLILAFIVHRFFATPVVVRSLPAAVVLIIAGFGIAILGASTFSRAGTELNPTSDANAKLVTNGPFAYTRNPMYAGVTLVSLGAAFFFGTLPFFVATVVLFLLVNSLFIPYEESKMERQYGAEFRAYKTRVRRWGIL